MKINLKELSTQAVESTTTERKMRMSDNAQSMVFQLFTKNVYSNPIGTIVREITSNCFDSHVEAGVKSPVIIRKSIDEETKTHYISFIDFGVGMSEERVYDIYGVYFESTKRVDNTQIGGFGIGGKTPLAYKRSNGQGEGEYDNTFFVITNYNGTKYYYCIYEGADTPIISPLHSEPTTERNGTEVRIPVLESDVEKFATEMIRQLYYFEDIVFEGFDEVWRVGETLSNEYQIIRGKTFLYRGNDYSSNVHICLGRVAYPIDYNVLGLNSGDYLLPVAIRLEVGDINVTVSRESIDYSESTIKLLKQKLGEVKEEILQLLVKQYEDIVTLEDYFKMKTDFGKYYFSNGSSISVSNMIKEKDIDFTNFKYSFTKMPNDKQLFRLFFSFKSFGKKPKRSRYSYNSNSDEFSGSYKELLSSNNLYYIEDEFNRKVIKQAYLKSEHDLYHIIERKDLCKNYVRAEIAELFNVHLDKLVDDNGKPVPFVQSLIEMQDEYFGIVQENTESYDELEVPEEFIIARRKRNMITPDMLKITIPVTFFSRYNSTPERVKLDDLFKFNMPIFYGNKEDEHKLKSASKVYRELFDENNVVYNYYQYSKTNPFRRQNNDNYKGGIMFIRIANGNFKYMKFCKNANHIDTVNYKLFYRKEDTVNEYFKTYKLLSKYESLDSLYKDENFNKIDEDWGKTIVNLNQSIEKIKANLNCSGLEYSKSYLQMFYKIDEDSKIDKRYQKVLKAIEDVQMLEEINNETLRFINVPSRLIYADEKLFPVLKKVMVL
ncbi:MAG: hypothetical protein M0R03_16370 [Novosphingobium sp.]|nr:hypothetical protein [Novosphingobium sp.]